MELFDVIEYRWDRTLPRLTRKGPRWGNWKKVCTHCTQVPKNMAYGIRRKIMALYPKSQYTKIIVVPNGSKQYSNQFK